VVSNTTLIYGKVSSIGATSECDGCADTTFSGYGVGVGFQTLLDKNWYLQGEVLANKYDDKVGNGATNNAKTTVLSFGVGYKF
jgi:opacity protein-like surface antigen